MDQEFEFRKLFEAWKSSGAKEDFARALGRVFISAPNPFDTLVALASHKEKPKQVEFLKQAISGLSWIERTIRF